MKTKSITEKVQKALESCKIEYISDTSWQYTNTVYNQTISISFSQNDSGDNSIDDFSYKHKGTWFDLTPTDEQVKLMYDKLNNTPYREMPEDVNQIETDPYEEYGVKRQDFY